METGRRAFLAGTLGAALAGTLPGWAAPAWAAQGPEAGTLRLDFGGATPEPAPGYVRVGTEVYTEARGYGWVSADGLSIRDRGGDAPQRDFVFGKAAHVFRIGSLAPGRYRLRVLSGDLTFADHFTRLRVPGVDGGEPLPVLHPSYAQFAELTATLVVPEGGTGSTSPWTRPRTTGSSTRWSSSLRQLPSRSGSPSPMPRSPAPGGRS